ncbi:MAG: PfkB family carbohydrate kinase, partial [Lutibacter sp.]
KPTGTVSVKLNNGIPSYVIHENVAWDFIQLKKESIEALKKADAICFGSLGQRSIESYNSIIKALKIVPDTALKVYDINIRAPFYNKEIIENSLKLANVFKLNDEELIILKNMFELKGNQEEVCMQIIKLFNLKFLALTNGSKGSLLFSSTEISKLSVPKIKVVDTVGAGDSFTAAMIIGLLNKKPLKTIHKEAVAHAARVCQSKGATPNFL